MRVREVMTPDPLILTEDVTVDEAADMFFQADVRAAPVVGQDGRVIGLVRDADLLAATGQRRLIALLRSVEAVAVASRIPVRDVLMTDFPTVAASDDVRAAASLLLDHADAPLAVVIDGHRVPIGVVSRRDLLRCFGPRDDAEILHDIRTVIADALLFARRHDVRADVEQGVVRLVGTLHDDFDVMTVVSLVASIPGVARVDTRHLRSPVGTPSAARLARP